MKFVKYIKQYRDEYEPMKPFHDTDTYRKIHFAVMAIESGAQKMNIPAQEMMCRLNKVGLIHKRLIRHYDMLHTQSLEYVADDIVETLRNREARL